MHKPPLKYEKKQTSTVSKQTADVKIIDYNGLKWIDIIRPTENEIEMLKDI